jgi:hypothetical protein
MILGMRNALLGYSGPFSNFLLRAGGANFLLLRNGVDALLLGHQ